MATGLSVIPTGSHDARVKWQDEPGDTSLQVFRSPDNLFTHAVLIGTVLQGVGYFNDHALTPATSYFYWLVGVPSGASYGPVEVTTAATPVKGTLTRDIEDAIFAWVQSVVGPGIPDSGIVWRFQSDPKALKPYILLYLGPPVKVPSRDHSQNFGESMGGDRQYRVTVEAYTDCPDPEGTIIDANQYISDLEASLDDDNVASVLDAAGIGIAQTFAPVDLSTLLETKFERRVSFDFYINVASNYPVVPAPSIDVVSPPQGTYFQG